MTIVCGYKDRGGAVWMGCDSRSMGGGFIFPERVDKIIRHGGWTMGFSGNNTGLTLLSRKAGGIANMDDPEDVARVFTRTLIIENGPTMTGRPTIVRR